MKHVYQYTVPTSYTYLRPGLCKPVFATAAGRRAGRGDCGQTRGDVEAGRADVRRRGRGVHGRVVKGWV